MDRKRLHRKRRKKLMSDRNTHDVSARVQLLEQSSDSDSDTDYFFHAKGKRLLQSCDY